MATAGRGGCTSAPPAPSCWIRSRSPLSSSPCCRKRGALVRVRVVAGWRENQRGTSAVADWMGSNELVQCLVLDGAFVLEMLRGAANGGKGFAGELGYSSHDTVFATRGTMHRLQLGNAGGVAGLAVRFFSPLMPTAAPLPTSAAFDLPQRFHPPLPRRVSAQPPARRPQTHPDTAPPAAAAQEAAAANRALRVEAPRGRRPVPTPRHGPVLGHHVRGRRAPDPAHPHPRRHQGAAPEPDRVRAVQHGHRQRHHHVRHLHGQPRHLGRGRQIAGAIATWAAPLSIPTQYDGVAAEPSKGARRGTVAGVGEEEAVEYGGVADEQLRTRISFESMAPAGAAAAAADGKPRPLERQRRITCEEGPNCK
ncbi:hypothetical protein ACP70R_012817 [Stipagrostis hirtigluma subsp. patula]